VEIGIPRSELVDIFQEFVALIDAQIKNLHLSTVTPMNARDLLLPRLMDGRLSV